MQEYKVDAKNRPVGRIASEIAILLQGKATPLYNPKDSGDVRVFVSNIENIKVTGKKAKQKVYYHHTGYIGHLKEKTYQEAFDKNPEWVLRNAVKGMLPKNKLLSVRMKQLVFVSKKDK
ncbi:MAG: 50S ribosomal protein L13 [bacterium]